MSAAWESLHLAARELASEAPIKERLKKAFSKHLEHLDAEQLPRELRQRFRELHAQMTCVPPLRGESAVCATVRKMSNDEAGECARSIIDLLGALTPGLAEGRPQPRKPVRSALDLPRLIAEV